MKKIIFVLSILALVISVSSCGNKKKKENHPEGTHVHSDGTVHPDNAHSNDNAAKPAQESFEVKADKDAEHKHEGSDNDHDGHKHEQEDGDHEGHEHGDEARHDHDHENGEHK